MASLSGPRSTSGNKTENPAKKHVQELSAEVLKALAQYLAGGCSEAVAVSDTISVPLDVLGQRVTRDVPVTIIIGQHAAVFDLDSLSCLDGEDEDE